MQQYFFSTVIGTGSDNDPYRLKVQDQIPTGNVSAIIPSDITTGHPLFTWGLAIVSADDLTTAINDATNHPVPQIALDSKLTILSNPAQNALKTTLNTLGVGSTWIGSQTTLRDVVNKAGRFLDAHFDANNFWVN